jgi:hypothetical protein
LAFVVNGTAHLILKLLQIGMFLAAVVTKAFSGLESDWGEFRCEAMGHRPCNLADIPHIIVLPARIAWRGT